MATTEHGTWYDRIAACIDHVETHLDEDLDAARLSEVAGFSLHHFHRVFRGTTGESAMGFVRRLRLERAAQHLRFGTSPVTQIAFDVGYGSHEAFTRAFRARFGMAPRTFRARAQSIESSVETSVRSEPDRVALGLRHVGPYEECGAVWQSLAARPDAWRLLAKQEASVGLAYDDPDVTRAEQLRYDACIVLPREIVDAFETDGTPWVRREIPGGTYAVARHHGPYDDILDTYVGLLGVSLPRRRVELAPEPTVEIYVVGPESVAPEDYVTDVCVRLK